LGLLGKINRSWEIVWTPNWNLLWKSGRRDKNPPKKGESWGGPHIIFWGPPKHYCGIEVPTGGENEQHVVSHRNLTREDEERERQ